MSENANAKPKNRGNAGKGRPRGSLNKTTRAAREAIDEVFEGLGGVQGMLDWARTNTHTKTLFYSSIYPKMLPLKVHKNLDVSGQLAAKWLPSE